MKTVPFGNTGVRISPLGIGCTDNPEVMHLLLDAGCNLVDTAQCYGPHERFLGEQFAPRRDGFFLQSKCGHHEVLPDGSLRSLRISMADIDAALQNLRTEHLDAMLLHSYDLDALRQGDAIEVLLAAKAAVAKGPLPAEVLQQVRTAFQQAEAASGRPWPGEN